MKFHDYALDRTSDGTGLIMNFRYAELLQLDIGGWMDPAFAGQRIWTLDQLLDFCRETGLILNLELKNDVFFYPELEQRVIDSVCRRGMQEQVLVSSFNHPSMQLLKTMCSEIRTGLLYDKPLLDIKAYLERSNADCVHPPYLLLRQQPDLIPLFHNQGMKVNTWTVDLEPDIRSMTAAGADGLISNWPDRLCRVAAELSAEG